MEHTVSNQTIIYNVLTQAVNLIIFFLVFKYFFAKKIVDGLSERKSLIAKLQHADDEYKTIVSNAESAAKEIIWEANTMKKAIIDEASALAKQKADVVLEEAEQKAWNILQTAQVQVKTLEQDLKDNYETMVKTTAGSYLKKIFDKETEMQTAYLEKVIKGIVS